jgi:hypothetical protein
MGKEIIITSLEEMCDLMCDNKIPEEPYICDTCKNKENGWDTEPCDGCCKNHSGYEPCDDVAKDCYEELCRYFGDAKDILKNREDFKAWLDRIKWHIHKAEELSAENDDLRDQLAMRDRFQKQEPTGHCKDCKYFEYDSVAKVDGIPLIVAHEICSRWGDGCKTKEDGYCFLFEPQERSK